MRIDWYTKAVLTVIAVCLIWLSVGGPSLLQTVQAQTNNRVIIEGWLDTAGKVHTPEPMRKSVGTEAMPVAVIYNTR